MTPIVLYLSHIVLFFFLARKYGKEIIEGLKGDNGKWDAPEIITGLWIVLFPAILLANLFLDFDVSNNLWISMDVILLVSLGIREVKEFNRKK